MTQQPRQAGSSWRIDRAGLGTVVIRSTSNLGVWVRRDTKPYHRHVVVTPSRTPSVRVRVGPAAGGRGAAWVRGCVGGLLGTLSRFLSQYIAARGYLVGRDNPEVPFSRLLFRSIVPT